MAVAGTGEGVWESQEAPLQLLTPPAAAVESFSLMTLYRACGCGWHDVGQREIKSRSYGKGDLGILNEARALAPAAVRARRVSALPPSAARLCDLRAQAHRAARCRCRGRCRGRSPGWQGRPRGRSSGTGRLGAAGERLARRGGADPPPRRRVAGARPAAGAAAPPPTRTLSPRLLGSWL